MPTTLDLGQQPTAIVFVKFSSATPQAPQFSTDQAAWFDSISWEPSATENSLPITFSFSPTAISKIDSTSTHLIMDSVVTTPGSNSTQVGTVDRTATDSNGDTFNVVAANGERHDPKIVVTPQ